VARTIDEILTPETGQILRQAREARGISIADVAERLRINSLFIESMEAGDLSPLPPGPYRKAFLTEYAKFLNIKLETLQAPSQAERDGIISSAVYAVPEMAKKVTKTAVKTTESAFKKVEEGVKDAVEEITARDLWQEADQVRKERLGITEQREHQPRIITRKRDQPSDLPVSIPPIAQEESLPIRESRRARKLEEETLQESFSPHESDGGNEEMRSGMSRATKTVVGLLILITAIIVYSLFTTKTSPPTATIEPEHKTIKQPEQKARPAPKKDTGIVTPVAFGDSLIFTISAKDSVWISVSPDIGKGFRGKLGKGEMKRFSAKDKYFIFLGNQKAVSMTLDGKAIANLPTIPGSNIVVRNVVLERGKISLAPNGESQKKTTETPPNSKSKRSNKKNPKPPLITTPIPHAKPKLPR
jgi:transcriptional regulator with XRE-family HTH domain